MSTTTYEVWSVGGGWQATFKYKEDAKEWLKNVPGGTIHTVTNPDD